MPLLPGIGNVGGTVLRVGAAAFATVLNGEGLTSRGWPVLRGTPDAPLGRRGGIMSIRRSGSGK